jgi:hypothetical protein
MTFCSLFLSTANTSGSVMAEAGQRECGLVVIVRDRSFGPHAPQGIHQL